MANNYRENTDFAPPDGLRLSDQEDGDRFAQTPGARNFFFQFDDPSYPHFTENGSHAPNARPGAHHHAQQVAAPAPNGSYQAGQQNYERQYNDGQYAHSQHDQSARGVQAQQQQHHQQQQMHAASDANEHLSTTNEYSSSNNNAPRASDNTNSASTRSKRGHAHEFHAQDDMEDEEDESESDSGHVKKVKKGISKKTYEPIIEGNVVYRYEDNHVEYMRARKRVQNRESATRVRGRKKNYTQHLEEQLENVRRTNSELLLTNAKLAAENNMLRGQVAFMQNMMLKSGGGGNATLPGQNGMPLTAETQIDNASASIRTANTHSSEDTEYAEKTVNPPLFERVPASQNVHANNRKHLMLLCLATILVCSLWATTSENRPHNGALITYDNLVSALQKSGTLMSSSAQQGEDPLLGHIVTEYKRFCHWKGVASVVTLVTYVAYFLYVVYKNFYLNAKAGAGATLYVTQNSQHQSQTQQHHQAQQQYWRWFASRKQKRN